MGVLYNTDPHILMREYFLNFLSIKWIFFKYSLSVHTLGETFSLHLVFVFVSKTSPL